MRDIRVEWVGAGLDARRRAATAGRAGALRRAAASPTTCWSSASDRYGDFSTYPLRLVRSPLDDAPPPGFDPRLVGGRLLVQGRVPERLRLRAGHASARPSRRRRPSIDYLAKDYASFRRLMLDRIAQLVPDWRERSAGRPRRRAGRAARLRRRPPELPAGRGRDRGLPRHGARAHLAAPPCAARRLPHARRLQRARLGARRRSVPTTWRCRRPARASSRRVPGHAAAHRARTRRRRATALRARPDGLRAAARRRRCTRRTTRSPSTPGATGAAACRRARRARRSPGICPTSQPGDVLVFEEVLGPATGEPGDADPAHRHVVRLTDVRTFSPDDPTAPLHRPAHRRPRSPRSRGRAEDALPFPLCISAVTDEAHGAVCVDDVSVARGNIVLADHGRTLPADEALGTRAGAGARPTRRIATPRRCGRARADRRFRRASGRSSRTRRSRSPARCSDHRRSAAPASTERAAVRSRRARRRGAAAGASTMRCPRSRCASTLGTRRRTGSRGATCSTARPTTPHFVVEVEDDGAARLRFGDDAHGRRPRAGTAFTARYRVGNGARRQRRRRRHRPCRSRPTRDVLGGAQPAARARRRRPGGATQSCAGARPQAFRTPGARGHAGGLRGSDRAPCRTCSAPRRRCAGPAAGTPSSSPSTALGGAADRRRASSDELARHVERYRMAGHDLEFDDPVYVSLELDAARLRAGELLPQPTCSAGLLRGARATACCPTAGAACSIPTTSASARPST